LAINTCKLKTHTLTKLTGAVKNLYGSIPGGVKQMYHRDAKGEKNFSNLLVDIYQNIKPELNIMDAVIAMEGEGPSSGKPKNVKLLLASKNAIALDIAASELMGYSPKKIFTIKEAVKRKLGNYNIKIVGDLKKIPNLKFEKPSSFKRVMVNAFLIGMTREKIIVDKDKCVKCGLCAEKCPMKAISLNPYPIINPRKCIRCFCCIEVCPQHAIHLRDNIPRKTAKLVRKIKK
jgi:ferredoxin